MGKHERRTYAHWDREREAGRFLPDPGPTRVDSFLNFYAKVKHPARMRQFVHSSPLTATVGQDLSVAYLDRLRNDLFQYSDTTVVVGINGPRKAVDDAIAVSLYPFDPVERADHLPQRMSEPT